MCGIFGGCYFGHSSDPNIMDWMFPASSLLQHRGPDSRGSYQSKNKKIQFFHQRLKIRDLTDLSSQPMQSSDGSVVMVFNGEIYNYVELRETLKELGYKFNTSGDTEVLLYSYLNWGCDF